MTGTTPVVDAGLLHRALRQPRQTLDWHLGEWDVAIRQASRAGVTARLALALDGAQVLARVPPAPRHHLEAALVVVAKHRRDVRFEVACIEDALRPLQLDILLLKGAAYVLQDLPLSRARLFHDVDIMVRRDSLDAVEKALQRNGWAAAPLDSYDQDYYREWTHELPPFVHGDRGTLLDVHHTILAPTATPNPDPARLLADSRRVRGRLRVLDPVDQFLHSATHLFHEGEFDHGFRDLLDLRDLLETFRDEQAFARRVARRARDFGLERIAHHALRSVTRFWGGGHAASIQVPDAAPGPGAQALMDSLFDRALAPMHPSCDDAFSAAARLGLYIRGHWLRMPPRLLFPHLAHKAVKRLQERPHGGT